MTDENFLYDGGSAAMTQEQYDETIAVINGESLPTTTQKGISTMTTTTTDICGHPTKKETKKMIHCGNNNCKQGGEHENLDGVRECWGQPKSEAFKTIVDPTGHRRRLGAGDRFLPTNSRPISAPSYAKGSRPKVTGVVSANSSKDKACARKDCDWVGPMAEYKAHYMGHHNS